MTRLEKLLQFLAEDPNDSFTRYAIGLEFGGQKNYLEAIRWMEELRAECPDYVPTYYQLASYYRELKKKNEAKAIYKKGIEVARQQNDLHAASELQLAFEELETESEFDY